MQGAREGFRSAPGISLDGKTHFRECRLKLFLPQQEISVAPRNLGRKRINLPGVQIGVTRRIEVVVGFVGGGKIQPRLPRRRIQRERRKVGTNGTRDVWICGVVLPIAAEEIPVARIDGLEACGAFNGFSSLQTSIVDRKRISDAEERKDKRDSERNGNKRRALRIAGETQNHSPVLCLERFRVARQKKVESRENGVLPYLSEIEFPCTTNLRKKSHNCRRKVLTVQ